MTRRTVETSSHWGSYLVDVSDDGTQVLAAHPHDDDPYASPAIGNVEGAHRSRSRIARPAVRRDWLERGPGPDDGRGRPDQSYVEVPWDEVLDRLAGELQRVRTEFGNEAIFGGSYGWGSAGRFHHAQSQLHRFLNTIGGYTRSVNSYSRGSSVVLLPHLIGARGDADLRSRPVPWREVAEHTDLFVSFGGVRRSNTQIVAGGHHRNVVSGLAVESAKTTTFVSISALRDDAHRDLDAEWIPIRPASDTAAILAMIHVLLDESLADEEFLARCTVGAERVRRYVLGLDDGTPKTPEWAEALTGIPAAATRALVRRMAMSRTLVNVNFSLQRGELGEQPVFAALTLAAFLGQIGLPGGGFGHGYGSMGDYGVGVTGPALPTFRQGVNPVATFIPCARISDLLLEPGSRFPYGGSELVYPDIRLVYWAGGNPFHHHQDLLRLRRALSRVDTLVVNETHWTATARHADIVLPATSTLERDDLAAGAGDTRLRVSRRAVAPRHEARHEFDIFGALADRLGSGPQFHEGRSEQQWLRHLYETWRDGLPDRDLPDFDGLWAAGGADLDPVPYTDPVLREFRADPERHRLDTPSGRIELFSATLDGFGLPDCPGLATWIQPTEFWRSPRAERFDLHLLTNQPATRLHSQQDMGAASQADKVQGREPIRLNPDDAAARGLSDGQVVRVHNDRGSILAGLRVTTDVLPGVAQMSTGAWFDGSAPHIADCIHGNVNVLTRDVGTSSLAQGSTGSHVLVAVESFTGDVPPVRAYEPPRMESG